MCQEFLVLLVFNSEQNRESEGHAWELLVCLLAIQGVLSFWVIQSTECSKRHRVHLLFHEFQTDARAKVESICKSSNKE